MADDRPLPDRTLVRHLRLGHRLSHGVPVGGELELLDDGTLMAALSSRRPF